MEYISYKKNKDPYKFLKENQIENNFSNKFYTMLQKENSITLLKTSALDKIEDCEALYIPYEGHPSICHNERFYHSIIKLLNKTKT